MKELRQIEREHLFILAQSLCLDTLRYLLATPVRPYSRLFFLWSDYYQALNSLYENIVLGLCYDFKSECERAQKFNHLRKSLDCALTAQVRLRRVLNFRAQLENEWYAEQLVLIRELFKDLKKFLKWFSEQSEPVHQARP